MRKLFLALLFVAPLFAQISQLATTADGNTLLFHTNFRLQSETDLGAQGKIYSAASAARTPCARGITSRSKDFNAAPMA